MKIDNKIVPGDLRGHLSKFWELSGAKIKAIEKQFVNDHTTPVFTKNGIYSAQGWTEWTQGFQFGSSILHFDATGDREFLEIGKKNTVAKMAPHVTHIGVHDHGFNNLSTYGNLLRLMNEGKIPFNEWESNFYAFGVKASGAVQASRWTRTKEGGFIYSFNGPHSLFVDTIRTCRILVLAHMLGHVLMGENDIKISLLDRAVQHLQATADWSVFYGEGRDHYDVRGRTAHESIFNVNDGNFRCPNAQQGYTGFSTWTRGLAWAMLGFAEELECFEKIPAGEFQSPEKKKEITDLMMKAALATADFYIAHTATDGIPYWDTGAPGLVHLGDYLNKSSDPYNPYEPVDSSAAAITAQGLLRLGKYLIKKGDRAGNDYFQAGLSVSKTLLEEPYLSTDPRHQGLLLHSIYHRPNGWDYVPDGKLSPYGESSMWGDYHVRELGLYLQRLVDDTPDYHFFNGIKDL